MHPYYIVLKYCLGTTTYNIYTTDNRLYKDNFPPHLEIDFLLDTGAALLY